MMTPMPMIAIWGMLMLLDGRKRRVGEDYKGE